MAARESITVLRSSLADAEPEALPQREALAIMLGNFDIARFVGLSAPLLLPDCQPAEWVDARSDVPFRKDVQGDASREHCTIRVKTLTGKLLRWRFEVAEAIPLRPGESIWARIYVFELVELFLHDEGGQNHLISFMLHDAGTWRTLSHRFLSLEAYGVFGAELRLEMMLLGDGDVQAQVGWWDVSRVDLMGSDLYDWLVLPFNPKMLQYSSGKAGWIQYSYACDRDSWTETEGPLPNPVPVLSCRVVSTEPNPLLDPCLGPPGLAGGTKPSLLLRVEHPTLGPGTLVGWSRWSLQQDQFATLPSLTYFTIGENVFVVLPPRQDCACARVQFDRLHEGLRRWNVPISSLSAYHPRQPDQELLLSILNA
jgi:hypothetical protein